MGYRTTGLYEVIKAKALSKFSDIDYYARDAMGVMLGKDVPAFHVAEEMRAVTALPITCVMAELLLDELALHGRNGLIRALVRDRQWSTLALYCVDLLVRVGALERVK
jgi:hypothetical protein